MKIKTTEKDKALLAAIDCGLIPEPDESYEYKCFVEFWESYVMRLYRRNLLWKQTSFLLAALVISLVALLIILVQG